MLGCLDRLKRTVVTLLAAVTAVLLATTVSACGGSGGGGGDEVVARVGSEPITKAEVSHWMATLAGGSYYELSGRQTVPAGLVSDPPHYGQCVARLEAAAAAAPSKKYQATGVQLLNKCRELNLQIRLAATALLVSVHFVFGLAKSWGVSATIAEALAALNQSNAARFPTPAALNAERAARRISLSDELLLMRKDVLANRLLAKLKAQQNGGFLLRTEAEWAARTDCKPGYVVEHCKQYKGEAAQGVTPSGAVLLEQVAALSTGRCTNLAACGKQ
jgi:hypothetical protein